MRPLIPVGGSAIIYGDPKVGKSYAALQLAVALRSGTPWFGFPVVMPVDVLYIQLDTSPELWKERLDDLAEAGVNTDDIGFADRETFDTFPFNILMPDHLAMLKRAVEERHPAVVIIDTIREVHRGDENDSTDMQSVIASLVAATMPATLIIISHARKPAAEIGASLINDMRGSSYVVGRMDAILRFTNHTLHYTGRSVEEGKIKLKRLENGFWAPMADEVDSHIMSIIADPAFVALSGRARARALAQKLGKTEAACRSLLRRYESPVHAEVVQAIAPLDHQG